MAELTADQKSAYDDLIAEFTPYGLEALGDWLWNAISMGKSDAWIRANIRDQEAYRKRFPGMEFVSKKGWGWTEADYIEQENSYREALKPLGGAASVFDNGATFAQWIEKGLSPAAVQRRVDLATDYTNLDAPGSVKDALREQYGLSDEEMAAYLLDPNKVGPALEVQYKQRRRTANVLAASRDYRMPELGDMAQELSDTSAAADYEDAAQKFRNVAEQGDSWRRLARLSGGDLSNRDLLRAEFDTPDTAGMATAKKKLASQERGRFSGSSGIGARSLATGGLGSQ